MHHLVPFSRLIKVEWGFYHCRQFFFSTDGVFNPCAGGSASDEYVLNMLNQADEVRLPDGKKMKLAACAISLNASLDASFSAQTLKRSAQRMKNNKRRHIFQMAVNYFWQRRAQCGTFQPAAQLQLWHIPIDSTLSNHTNVLQLWHHLHTHLYCLQTHPMGR